MRPLLEVVDCVLPQCPIQRMSSEQNHLVQALTLDGLHESLGNSVRIGSLEGSEDDLHSGILEDRFELLRELRVTIDDQESLPKKEAVAAVGEVTGNLSHEASIWVWRGACYVHDSAAVFDEEERVVGHEATCSPNLRREKVGTYDHVCMSLDKGPPRSRSVRGWFDAMLL